MSSHGRRRRKVWRRRCPLSFEGPVVSTLRRAYNAWHERYDVDRDSDAPWHRLVKRHIDEARDIVGKQVLEIASGRGGFACWLADRSPGPARLVAADFARTAVTKGRRFARERGIEVLRWEVADIQAINHPDATFHTVFCCETIEHVADPLRALREVARVLRPGGRLYLTAPNYFGPMGLYRVYLRATGRRFTEEGQPLNHALVLPRTVSWVRRVGLRVTVIDGTGHYLPFPGRPPVEITALRRLRWLTRWVGLHSVVVATTSVSGRGARLRSAPPGSAPGSTG